MYYLHFVESMQMYIGRQTIESSIPTPRNSGNKIHGQNIGRWFSIQIPSNAINVYYTLYLPIGTSYQYYVFFKLCVIIYHILLHLYMYIIHVTRNMLV